MLFLDCSFSCVVGGRWLLSAFLYDVSLFERNCLSDWRSFALVTELHFVLPARVFYADKAAVRVFHAGLYLVGRNIMS